MQNDVFYNRCMAAIMKLIEKYLVESITAVYNQTFTVYEDTPLDDLKADLVVTAEYADGTTEEVPADRYTLSGELVEETSTITVSYGGKTTTFNVTVSQRVIRVFKGKGTSGATIIDNANRALSEPFAFENVAPITLEFPTIASTGVQVSFKNTTTNENTIDTTALSLASDSEIGTSIGVSSWLSDNVKRTVCTIVSSKLTPYTFVTTSGYARLLFANSDNTSSPITSTIEGIIYINDIPYQLVEAPIEDFE